jgi:hypothetical protein
MRARSERLAFMIFANVSTASVECCRASSRIVELGRPPGLPLWPRMKVIVNALFSSKTAFQLRYLFNATALRKDEALLGFINGSGSHEPDRCGNARALFQQDTKTASGSTHFGTHREGPGLRRTMADGRGRRHRREHRLGVGSTVAPRALPV